MSPHFWMLLGEARSKCDHQADVPTPPAYAKDLHMISMSKGVHATTAIEGNTLSHQDVEARVRDGGQTASTTSYRESEVDNVSSPTTTF